MPNIQLKFILPQYCPRKSGYGPGYMIPLFTRRRLAAIVLLFVHCVGVQIILIVPKIIAIKRLKTSEKRDFVFYHRPRYSTGVQSTNSA